MKKALLALLLMLCVIFTLIPSVLAAEGVITGTGDETDPYIIADLADLKAFRDAVNSGNTYEGKYIKLAENASITIDGEWTPIGNGVRSGSGYTGNAFKGVFDGNYNTIYGLSITTTNPDTAGLFGVVDGGKITNFELDNVDINVTTKSAGAVVGLMVGGSTVSRISVSGSVVAADGAGGVVGRMTISGTVSNCLNKANVSGAAAGGIVGKAYYTGVDAEMEITACYNSGTITATKEGAAGGIVGFCAANVSHCVNDGDITATSGGTNIGGIVGWQQMYGEISDNENTGDIFSDATVTTAGGIVGWINYQYATDGTASEYPVYEVVSVKGNTNESDIDAENSVLGSGGIVGGIYNAAIVTGNTNEATSIVGSSFAAGIVGNMQFTSANGFADYKATDITENTSSTAIANITANCTSVLAYNNDKSVFAVDPVMVGNTSYATLADAINAASENGSAIVLLANINESIASIKNVTLTTNVAGGVTFTNTDTENWINMTNVTIGSGVTLEMDNAYYTDEGVNFIEGTLKVVTLYNANDSKTTVRNGGKIVTTGMIVNRYHDNADSGIYVYGDGDASTVDISCADTIGTYSGTFYAKDAVVEGNMMWIDYKKNSAEESDKYSQSTPVFENSVVNIADEFRLYKDATLTLTNSAVTAGKVQIRQDATPAVNVDSTSSIKATAVENLSGATMDAVLGEDGSVTFVEYVAKIGDKCFASLADALKAAAETDELTTIELFAGEFEFGSVKFPATLKNVTIKGADNKATIIKNSILNSSDGGNVHYDGITFDGIVFENSYIVFTGARSGEVVYKNWTITNCEFKDVVTTSSRSAIHFNLNSDETIENLTFTNNVIDGVSGGNVGGLRANYVSGKLIITGNKISNVAWNAFQVINSTLDELVFEDNVLAATATIANLYNVSATEASITNNQFLVTEGQYAISGIASADVSGNYWNGGMPANLPAGVTCSNYYTTVAEDGTLGGFVEIDPTVWYGSIDTSWYNTTDTEFTLTTAAQFAGFAAIANGTADGIEADTFKGKTIKLGADIDLNNILWAPIGGRTSATLSGQIECTFDGQGHTISNLKVEKGAAYEAVNMNIGLFGITRTGSFVAKNFTLNNVDIYGAASVAAVLGRTVNCTAKIENVTVTGDIKIEASTQNVGAICAQGYSPVITDCHVIGNDGSYIKAGTKQVGGILGWSGESAKTTAVKNCSVENVTISGQAYVGSIASIIQYGATVTDNSAKNVTLNVLEGVENNGYYYGTLVGSVGAGYVSSAGANVAPVTLSGNTAENVTVTLNGEAVEAPVEYGAHYEGTSYLTAKIGNDYYENISVAIAAVKEDETIVLLDNVTVTTPAHGQNALNHARAVSFTLDLGTHTLYADTGNSVIRFNITDSGATDNVTLTIKNGKIVAGSNTWCAVMAAGVSADVKAIMNLEDLTIESSKAGDLAVKAWANGVINANNVIVNATNGAGGFYAVGGEIVLDNCTVNQTGLHTSPYLSMAVAVSNEGKLTVNSGTYSSEPTAASEGYDQGSSHGSWVGGVMSSGGTLIINGGTFSNGNFGEDSLATAARAMFGIDAGGYLEINNGTFNALKNVIYLINNIGDAALNPTAAVNGGKFSADPTNNDGYGTVALPEGHAVFELVENEFTIEKIVAKIGDTPFASLADAIAAADDGDVVTLLTEVTLTEAITIEKAITIEGNGNNITVDDDYILIKADLTLNNVVVTAGKYAYALSIKANDCDVELNNCTVTGPIKGYGTSNYIINSGTYMKGNSAFSSMLNGALVYGGTFYYEIPTKYCASGYAVVNNGDGTWTVKYDPACFIDADNDGIMDEGEVAYGSLEALFAADLSGEVTVVLLKNVSTDKAVDTASDTTYNFVTYVDGGVTMDWNYTGGWNYIQNATIGENVTLNVPYRLCVWTKLDVYGTINTGYFYLNGGETTIHEGAVVNADTGEKTTQVKNGTVLTVNGTLNTSTLNVWVGGSKLVVSGDNAKVNAAWIDIWDGTPVVTVENGATLTVDGIKASRGGEITVDNATLAATTIEIGHNGESAGKLTESGDSIVTGDIKMTATGSTVASDGGLNVTTDLEGYKVVFEDGEYKVVECEYVAQIGDDKFETLADAFAAAKEGDTIEILAGTHEFGSVKFPATLKNVIIKGADNKATIIKNSILNSSDGGNVHYDGITFDGIVFENSYIVFTGARSGEVVYKNWTITNCEFKDVVTTSSRSAIHFNLNSDETIENLTFTNNVIDGVSGGSVGGLRANYVSGKVIITGNKVSNVAWNAFQIINSTLDELVFEDNVLAATATIANLYNVSATEASITNNQFLVTEDQYAISGITGVDVSGNYWNGGAPANLPDGVTCENYYTTVAEDGTLGGLTEMIVGALKFYSANLSLENDFTVNFKARVDVLNAGNYTDPYVIFNFYGTEIRVDGVLDGDVYVFSFKHVAPHLLGENIKATIYATLDGEVVEGQTIEEYSIATYCYHMLGNEANANNTKLITILVDILNYGAAAQNYMSYNVDALVNADLTDEQMDLATADRELVDSLDRAEGEGYAAENEKATWKAATLVLKNNITVSLKFAAAEEDIDNLTVKVEMSGQSYTFNCSELYKDSNGFYVVEFNSFNADQMSDLITATVYEGETVVSKTLTYSVESYAARHADEATVGDLVKAMIKYGDSAKAYKE